MCDMLRILLASLTLASASPVFVRDASTGCRQALPSGQSPGSVTNVSIVSNGVNRSYLVFVPPTYLESVPTSLILSYHGGNKNAMQQLQLDGLTTPYYNNDSMVIYPQGIKVSIDNCGE
jgi:poly(3-hydroxybutyrate) depolymerase